MFKHVETMRKIAFRIMNKSFGARKKETGEAIYDAYPLNRLMDLLCFEDLDEARAACAHYSITVKQVKVSSTRDEVADVVFWRQSDFKEPTHPEKGFVIPLQPRKMARIIERKLNGATRLAVCRGEVSGEGATLHSVPAPAGPSPSSSSMQPASMQPAFSRGSPAISAEEKAKAATLLKKQQLEIAKLEREEKLREHKRDEMARKQNKQEEERLKREAAENEAKQLEKQRLMNMIELKKREEEALEAKRQKEETERLAAEERVREEARRREAEKEAKIRAEEARRKAEEDRRLAEEARLREEAARIERERQQRILAEQRRIEEAKRQEMIRRELEAKRRREEEEKRKAKEWEDKVNAARKLVLWKRWKNRVSRSIEMTDRSAASLKKLDPTFLSDTLELGYLLEKARVERADTTYDAAAFDAPMDMRRAIEASVLESVPKISLSEMTVGELASSQNKLSTTESLEENKPENKITLLLKVALLIPTSAANDSQRMSDLIKSWLHSRLGLGKVLRAQSWTNDGLQSFEARSVIKFCASAEDCSDCDVALVVVPPPWSTSSERRKVLQSASSLLDDFIPRVVLALGDFDHEGHEYMKSVLAESLGAADSALPIICNRTVTPLAIEKALESSCKKIASIFVNESCVKIDRISTSRLASNAISAYLWNRLAPHATLDGNVVLECARSAISAVIEEADAQARENDAVWSSWPPLEFASENGVEGYFLNGSNLPLDWKYSLTRARLEKELIWMSHRLTGSFRDVIESLLFEAPKARREECGVLAAQGYYRRCLQEALDWFADHSDDSDHQYIFLPRGLLEVIVDQLPSHQDKLGTDPVPALLIPPDNSLLEAIEDGTLFGANQLYPSPPKEDRSLLSSKSNKRTAEWTSPSNSVLGGTKKRRALNNSAPPINKDLDDSSAFSKKLQDLMNGGTVDLMVGDHYLSSIMSHVPKLSTD
jgi:hypothetical protein